MGVQTPSRRRDTSERRNELDMQPEENGAEEYWKEKTPEMGNDQRTPRKLEETHVLFMHSRIKHERAREECCTNKRMLKPVAHKN